MSPRHIPRFIFEGCLERKHHSEASGPELSGGEERWGFGDKFCFHGEDPGGVAEHSHTRLRDLLSGVGGYIYTERERKRESVVYIYIYIYMCTYIYIYIYMNDNTHIILFHIDI